MAYVFTLSDLAGNKLSELPAAKAKEFTRSLAAMSTGQVRVPLWHDMADVLLEGNCLLKVVDVVNATTRVNCFHGELVTAEEVGDATGGSVAATFADGFWALMRRLCGKSTTGYSYGSAVSLQPATTIIADLLAITNAESPTGLRLGAVTASPADQYTGPHYYTKIGPLIAQLAAVLNGPDWRIDPIDAVPSSNPLRANYSELVMAPTLGVSRLDSPFEYGGGRLNVKSYKRAVTKEGTANAVYNLPAGFPDTANGTVVVATDLPSQAARGLLEDTVSTDVTVQAIRQQLVDYHAAVRYGPRQTITFDPVNDLSYERVPRLRTDYDVGDVVPFNVSVIDDNGDLQRRINILSRIYSVKITVDDFGVGTPSLTVTPT